MLVGMGRMVPDGIRVQQVLQDRLAILGLPVPF